MDEAIRNLQRQIILGKAIVEQLDVHLRRIGYEYRGETDEFGSQPNEVLYLVPLEGNLVSIAIRERGGKITFIMEEISEPGEHVGEYVRSDAERTINNYLENAQALWAVEGTVCANPECAMKDRVIITSSERVSSPGWSAIEDHLRCVECGYEWTDWYNEHWNE